MNSSAMFLIVFVLAVIWPEPSTGLIANPRCLKRSNKAVLMPPALARPLHRVESTLTMSLYDEVYNISLSSNSPAQSLDLSRVTDQLLCALLSALLMAEFFLKDAAASPLKAALASANGTTLDTQTLLTMNLSESESSSGNAPLFKWVQSLSSASSSLKEKDNEDAEKKASTAMTLAADLAVVGTAFIAVGAAVTSTIAASVIGAMVPEASSSSSSSPSEEDKAKKVKPSSLSDNDNSIKAEVKKVEEKKEREAIAEEFKRRLTEELAAQELQAREAALALQESSAPSSPTIDWKTTLPPPPPSPSADVEKAQIQARQLEIQREEEETRMAREKERLAREEELRVQMMEQARQRAEAEAREAVLKQQREEELRERQREIARREEEQEAARRLQEDRARKAEQIRLKEREARLAAERVREQQLKEAREFALQRKEEEARLVAAAAAARRNQTQSFVQGTQMILKRAKETALMATTAPFQSMSLLNRTSGAGVEKEGAGLPQVPVSARIRNLVAGAGAQLRISNLSRLTNTSSTLPSQTQSRPSLWTSLDRLRARLAGRLSLRREDLAKLGLNVLLSYGFVSNLSYVTCLILSWVAHGRRTGLSPLAPRQWKAFLAVYVGFWAANNLLRPLRFSVSLALSPSFDRLISAVEKRQQGQGSLGRSRATAVVIFLVNFCGTLTYLFGGLLLATSLARVPLLP